MIFAGHSDSIPGFLLATGCLCLPACDVEPDHPAIPEYALGSPEIIISQESGLLARPADLGLDSSGNIFVLDRIDQRVVSVSPTGELLGMVGTPGSGPGEFETVLALGIDPSDNVCVFDFGKGVVHVFSASGVFLSQYRPGINFPGRYSFGANSSVAYAGAGAVGMGGLVSVFDPDHEETPVIGELISEDTTIPPTLLEQIHRGEIPGFMRNSALPVFSSTGGLWLFLQTEGLLRRYGPDGLLELEREVSVPEMTSISEDYLEWYAGVQSPQALRYFEYVEHGVAFDGGVWLLWDTPVDQPGLVTIHDSEGMLTDRLVLDDVREEDGGEVGLATPSVRRIAVDPVRRRLYLIDEKELVLVAFPIPDDVF